MTTSPTIDPLRLRRIMGRDQYWAPEPFGPDGWVMKRSDLQGSVIATAFSMEDCSEWLHASISYVDHVPAYHELARLHLAVWGEGYAYQVFAPPHLHVNIHPYALHLWGRVDGQPALPEFATGGSI